MENNGFWARLDSSQGFQWNEPGLCLALQQLSRSRIDLYRTSWRVPAHDVVVAFGDHAARHEGPFDGISEAGLFDVGRILRAEVCFDARLPLQSQHSCQAAAVGVDVAARAQR